MGQEDTGSKKEFLQQEAMAQGLFRKRHSLAIKTLLGSKCMHYTLLGSSKALGVQPIRLEAPPRESKEDL
jgi:hypothetical protein